MSARRPWLRLLVLIGLLSSLAAAWLLRGPSESAKLATARARLAAGDYAAAAAEADRLLAADPDSPPALLIAGEAAMRQGRMDAAVAYLDRVPETDDGWGPAQFSIGDIRLHEGRLSDAEARFRKVRARKPQNVEVANRLALILGIEGRRWESAPYLCEQVQADRFTPQILLLLGNLEQIVELPAEIKNYRAKAPDDVAPLLGLARIALMEGDDAEAERLLRDVIAARPDLIEAHAQLGHLLLDRPEAEYLAWEVALPPAAKEHPEIWVVRGLRAARHEHPEVAARCFWEAVRRHPNHQAANYQLGQTLAALGRKEAAAFFLKRAETLQIVNRDLQLIYDDPQRADLMEQVSRRMDALGRHWEAWAWYRTALGTLGDDPQAAASRQQLEILHSKLLAERPPRTIFRPDADTATLLASYPLPSNAVPATARPASADAAGAGIAFADRAAAAGIDFAYFASLDPSTPGMRMLEFTGGGVGVLDYDADGWPDLHFPQGRPWTPADAAKRDGPPPEDRLYRNRRGVRFDDVTRFAGLPDPTGYGQGVTVGDFDGDGFDDLYVANNGPNRLYRNNGDGTFANVTAEAGAAGDDWTTSCVLTDLNADGLPDLYAVNYVSGDLTRVCQKDGRPTACSPVNFDPAQDRVWVNRGDGRFEDQTATAGIVVPDGKGLGILAADFDGDGRLNLFVANDTVANSYFVNRSAPNGSLAFDEQALLAGLAFDRDGKAQACMGVAAGDADDDGRLDLFVTNFFNESNTLFVRQPDGSFLDETRPSGLREPSYRMLGFGTQFLDADLDGRRDLVVTNGDVDDFGNGRLFHMPPQFFRNLGRGKFAEVPPADLGPFFLGKHLGRGLARLDWNRDGRDDFAVSHLDTPAALVTNETAAGGSLAIRLRGVSGSRDAIGTTVTVSAGNESWSQQLVAGDGYEASNQRQLVFGLGPKNAADRVSVRWPGGREQSFGPLAAGKEWLLIEGRDAALPLPR